MAKLKDLKLKSQFELGKCYATRDGKEVSGPLYVTTSDDSRYWETHVLCDGNRSWRADGSWALHEGQVCDLDLVPGEITEEYEQEKSA